MEKVSKVNSMQLVQMKTSRIKGKTFLRFVCKLHTNRNILAGKQMDRRCSLS